MPVDPEVVLRLQHGGEIHRHDPRDRACRLLPLQLGAKGVVEPARVAVVPGDLEDQDGGPGEIDAGAQDGLQGCVRLDLELPGPGPRVRVSRWVVAGEVLPDHPGK